MKTLIATLIVIGLASFAIAQDLDMPASGTAAAGSDEGGSAQSAMTAYDLIISKILEREAQYMAHQIHEGAWMVWGRDYWGWSSQVLENIDTSHFGQEAAQDAASANAAWNALSPAEAAAAKAVMQDSHQRVLAAGLN
ncbi:MAG: hypothetical protein AB7K09_19555 [Planctomycetota bacterium]